MIIMASVYFTRSCWMGVNCNVCKVVNASVCNLLIESCDNLENMEWLKF